MSKFLRRNLMIFIIKGFRTIVFILIVISTTFRTIWPPAFFRCLSSSGTYTELRTTSFIESTGVACSDSVSHNRVQVLSIPVLFLACSQDWTCNLQMMSCVTVIGLGSVFLSCMDYSLRQSFKDCRCLIPTAIQFCLYYLCCFCKVFFLFSCFCRAFLFCSFCSFF